MSSPNRMKFSSLVQKLDSLDSDFAKNVAILAEGFQRRETLIDRLVNALQCESDDVYTALDGNLDAMGKLDKVISAAVERFVVDNY